MFSARAMWLRAGRSEPTQTYSNQPTKPEELVKIITAINKAIDYMKTKMDCTEYQIRARTELNRIAKETDIFNPTTVCLYVSNLKRNEKLAKLSDISPEKPLTKGYKRKILYIYQLFCEANKLTFEMPTINYEAPIQIIPSPDEVNAIIANATNDYALMFKIMAETAVEADELHKTPMSQIDINKGILSINGNKQHNNGTYTLEPDTKAMLQFYLIKPEKNNAIKRQSPKSAYPFPTAKSMGNAWRDAREKASKKFQNKNLLNIPMKNLRNYAGAIYYFTHGKDAINTQGFMRHKNLQQTSNYLRGITGFQLRLQKIGKIATTAEEAMELILQGFKEESVFHVGTPQEKHLLTKINKI